MSAEKWFHRGKEARSLGFDRVIRDGRLSLESRQQFLAGWDEENRFRLPPTEAQLEESRRVSGSLKRYAALIRVGLEP